MCSILYKASQDADTFVVPATCEAEAGGSLKPGQHSDPPISCKQTETGPKEQVRLRLSSKPSQQHSAAGGLRGFSDCVTLSPSTANTH